MFQKFLTFFLGSKFERDQKRLKPIVEKINELEPSTKALSDQEIKNKTSEFRNRIANGETLDALLPEAFAVVREASVRTMGMRHFDVQLQGGIALHWGNIAEMKTGEGKTLTSTLAIYLNSLARKGVHVVTVNDYLARRDANWMKPIYDFLDISVGVIVHDMDHLERQKAYSCDITYGTNNEFGFDYLRDNMVSHLEHKVQRHHFFAIVDEVDSILIDEARTPLIISGPAEESTEKYFQINKIIPKLLETEHFEIDEKAKNALLTEPGVAKVEELLGVENLYHPENIELVHLVHQALKAHKLFHRDVDYVVQNGEVIIVDEFTGRLMSGRRYSDGLHQSLEAKEGVKIARESQTLASITFQNYFRIYEKLAGMTGTADTEAEEFHKIYNLDVIVIPSNKKIARTDFADRVYKSEKEKFHAILEDIKDRVAKKQPILVGTISIEKSELIANHLKQNGMPHNVLNAKFHDKEAEIIANAGKPGAITIATNMAGRGTDIVLGGSQRFKADLESLPEFPMKSEFVSAITKFDFSNAESIANINSSQKNLLLSIIKQAKEWKENHELVLANGGLHIIGTERHESRRIDNQLRGRSGRQGDPGSSRFYLSLQDDLMRIFGSDRIASIMEKLKMPEGQEIEHPMVSSSIARAQKRVEGHNFDIRKHLLEYDDVMNQQRIFIYKIRNSILNQEDTSSLIEEYLFDTIEAKIMEFCDGNNPENWEIDKLNEWLTSVGYPSTVQMEDYNKQKDSRAKLFDDLSSAMKKYYLQKKASIGEDVWSHVERNVFLDVLDHRWKEHLYAMDQLREGIWAVGYGERNPLVEYKLQGFRMFQALVETLKTEISSFLLRVEVEQGSAIKEESHEYKKIGEERRDDILGGMQAPNQQNGVGENGIPLPSTKPTVESVSSAGGSSKRKTGRRKNR